MKNKMKKNEMPRANNKMRQKKGPTKIPEAEPGRDNPRNPKDNE